MVGIPTHLPDVDGALRLGRPAAPRQRHQVLSARRVRDHQRVAQRLADSRRLKADLQFHFYATWVVGVCSVPSGSVDGLIKKCLGLFTQWRSRVGPACWLQLLPPARCSTAGFICAPRLAPTWACRRRRQRDGGVKARRPAGPALEGHSVVGLVRQVVRETEHLHSADGRHHLLAWPDTEIGARAVVRAC